MRPSQSILGQDMEGLEFLELYAGSGAAGFEALSCGAKKVTFVEKEERCARVIEGNQKLLIIKAAGKPLGQCEILNTDTFWAIKQLAQNKRKFDIVFIDPPYGHE